MATWHEFCGLARRFGGKQLNETGWMFDLQGCEAGRSQKVFVSYELMKPNFEFIQVRSAFVLINEVDTEQVLKRVGQLQAGSIGYSPLFDRHGNPIDGVLNISSAIPLAVLDLSEPTWFILYLNILARTADGIEQRISAPGSPDIF